MNADEFWAQVDRSGECRIWTGPADDLGYGNRRRVEGMTGRPHQIAYRLEVGDVPKGLELDHLCRNPRCCRPDHLEAVTHKENLLRGTSFAAERAKWTHCANGHEFTPENTYVGDGRRRCRECARAKQQRFRDKNPGYDKRRRSRRDRAPLTTTEEG